MEFAVEMEAWKWERQRCALLGVSNPFETLNPLLGEYFIEQIIRQDGDESAL